MTPTILEAIDDPHLLGTEITASASWKPWRAALAAIFGLGGHLPRLHGPRCTSPCAP